MEQLADGSLVSDAYEWMQWGVQWILAGPFTDLSLPYRIEGFLQETKTYVESLLW